MARPSYARPGGGITVADVASAISRCQLNDAHDWIDLAAEASQKASEAYGLPRTVESHLTCLTLGLVEVESSFERGLRYRAKSALHHTLVALERPLPQGWALGAGQVSTGRALYLATSLGLAPPPQHRLLERQTSVHAVALGLAKSLCLYADASPPTVTSRLARAVVLTHQSGFMAPQIARIQWLLNRATAPSPRLPLNGRGGPRTYGALGGFAGAVAAHEAVPAPPLLADPERASLFFATEIGQALYVESVPPNRRIRPYREPVYEVRKSYTGTIRSREYATMATRIWRDAITRS